jgi:hypothetical protein
MILRDFGIHSEARRNDYVLARDWIPPVNAGHVQWAPSVTIEHRDEADLPGSILRKWLRNDRGISRSDFSASHHWLHGNFATENRRAIQEDPRDSGWLFPPAVGFLIVVLRTELFQMEEGGCEVHRCEVYRHRAFHRREHLLVVLFEWASCCYESELSISR